MSKINKESAHGSAPAGPGGYAHHLVQGSGHVIANAGAAAELTARADAALAAAFEATLRNGVHGLCFRPYLKGLAPGSHVTAAHIRERLDIIRPYTRWVRT